MTVHRLDKTNTKAIPTICFLQKQELIVITSGKQYPPGPGLSLTNFDT